MPERSVAPGGEEWVRVCHEREVVEGAGTCALVDGVQIAVLRSGADGRLYAVQNRCPHWDEMVLWRGLTGEKAGEPKVACPMHKKTFSLRDGRCLSGEPFALRCVKVVEHAGYVFVERPSAELIAAERTAAERATPGACRAG